MRFFRPYDAIEVEARFQNENDARGYVTQPITIPLHAIDSIGGPDLATIKMMKDDGTVYACEKPTYEEVVRVWRVYRLQSWWRRLFCFLFGVKG